MKKILLPIIIFLICANFVKAQTYTLTRGLPIAEISGIGTPITGLTISNPTGPLNIGFSFNFMGTAYTQFYLGPHGVITFGSGSAASNLFIPSTSFGKDVIAFACAFQFPENGSPTINYFTSGVAPNRILVLNYKNVLEYANSSNITSVQVQLYENNGKIEIHNTLNAGAVGRSRTIGIQNASGNEGYTTTALNSSSTLSANNEMIRFSLPPPCSHSVSISSTSITICDGQSINLTPTITPSGTYTYQWLKDNVAIAGATTVNYTATTPGVYKLRVTDSGNCESFSNKITITKPFIPAIPNSFSWGTCQSQTASVSPSGTYTYQWFKSNTAISGETSSAFRPSTTGYYKVRATNSGGCSITSDSVNVGQNGVIANSTLIGYTCSNRSLGAYTGYFIGTESYLWTGPNNFTSTAQYPNLINLTTAQQGTYTVVATVPGCSSFTANTNLTVQPIALNPTNLTGYVCGSVQLNPNISTTPTNATTYSWNGPDGFTSSLQYPSVSNLTPAKQGAYTIQATIAGCTTLTAVSSVTVLQNTGSIGFYGNQQCNTTVLQYSGAFGSVTPSAYLWTGPNSFSSTLSSPQVANPTLSNSGVYTLRVTYSTCGTTTLTREITVEPYVIFSTSGDNTRYNLCPGQTLNLSASANLFSGTTYSWSGPSGFTSSVSNPSLTLTPNRVGTYTVTAMIAGCATATATTVVNTANISVTGRINNGSLHCPSNRVDLSSGINNSSAFDAPPSPTVISYQWTGPNGYNSTAKNPILPNVSTSNSGFYTLNAIISGGCVATSTSVVALNVRDNPNMTVYGGGTFCSGERITLGVSLYNNLGNGTTTASYQWNGPNGFSSTEREVSSVPVGMGGVYTISATFNNGCTGTYTNLVHIFTRRKPPLSVTNSSVCLGNNFSLYSNSISTFINSYSWTGPDAFSSTQQYPLITNATNAKLGVYTVTVTKTGCPETSSATLTVGLSTACNVVSSCYVSFINSYGNPCPGGSIFLRNYGQAGFYNPGTGYTSLSFSWSGPNGFTATGNGVIVENVTSSGTYTHTMTVVGGTCNGVYTAERLITVRPSTNTPIFAGTVSKSSLCEDDSFSFLNTINGGTIKNYSITGPSGFTFYDGSSSNPTLYANKPSESGTYTINGTMNGECQSSTADFSFSQSFNINIIPRPSPPSISSSSTNIQAGQSVTLTGSNCSNQINWSLSGYSGDTYNFTTANPFIDTPPVATTYWAICRSNEGCLSPSSNRIAVSLGAICTNMISLQSGLWTNPSIWSCGSVPTSANITTISVGHIVTIPASTSAFVRNLLNYGTLGYGQNASLRIGQ